MTSTAVSRCIVLVCISVILFTACEKGPVPVPDTYYSIGQGQLDFEKISTRPLPGGGSPRLFIGDVHGTETPEILVTGHSGLSVFDFRGRLLTESTFTDKSLDPGFLYDYDRDGKLDIVYGSTASDNLAVTVVNGCGNIIYRSRLPEQVYASVHPQFISHHTFFIVAREGWNTSPRGIIAADLPDLSVKWTFVLPSDPIKLSRQHSPEGEEIYTISHRTRHTGKYLYLGTEGRRLKPGDNSIRLFRTNPKGEIIDYRELLSGPEHTYHPFRGVSLPAVPPLPGKGDFFPLGPNSDAPLLLIQTVLEDEPNVPFFYLHLVGPDTAEISRSIGPFFGAFEDLRLVPAAGSSRRFLILWEQQRKQHRIDLFSSNLRHRGGKTFSGDTACLGPVLVPETADGTGTPRFIAADGDRLLLLDSSLAEQKAWTADSPRRLKMLTTDTASFLAAAGNSLEIWRLE